MKDFLAKINLDNKKIMFICILACIIFYLDFTFVFKLQFQNFNKLKTKITNLKKDINKLQKDLTNIQDLARKEKEGLKNASFGLKKMIPEEEVHLFLKKISELANANDIKIMQIKPIKEDKESPSKKKTAKEQNFSIELISFDLLGDYHHLGSFISDLEKDPTLLVLRELKISPHPKDYYHQDGRLVLEVYVKK